MGFCLPEMNTVVVFAPTKSMLSPSLLNTEGSSFNSSWALVMFLFCNIPSTL